MSYWVLAAMVVVWTFTFIAASLAARGSLKKRAELAERDCDQLIDAVDEVLEILRVHGWNTRHHDLPTRRALRVCFAKLQRAAGQASGEATVTTLVQR